MGLQVYNRYSGKKEAFTPLIDNRVGIYFCGMTVQDKPHMGHMLAFVAGDLIRRYLKHKGYDVTYVQNFTDIDDKIIAKANEEGTDYKTVAERNIAEYFDYSEQLGILPADIYPKATEHIDDIISLISTLVGKGFAYKGGDDVYFRVRKFEEYGKLSGRRVDELQSGARIEIGQQKEDPLDFTLWKGAREGEPSWDSPWGPGRPGWHIECSVMSMKYLGETLDMHGGGMDLVFPHHENEIAQSEAASGKQFVRYWMHNGLLNLSGEKMSKSTGHFFLIEDILKEFPGEVVRFFFLSTHFRSNSEFGRERLREAEAGYERIVNFCKQLARAKDEGAQSAGRGEEIISLAGRVMEDFISAMDDDFNSAEAVGHIFRLIREVNTMTGGDPSSLASGSEAALRLLGDMEIYDSILGLFSGGLPSGAVDVPPEVERMVAEREEARKAKDWARADELRGRILEAGFVIEDRPEGTEVREVRSRTGEDPL
jgi:cysteinyl-tRNA synthetase